MDRQRKASNLVIHMHARPLVLSKIDPSQRDHINRTAFIILHTLSEKILPNSWGSSSLLFNSPSSHLQMRKGGILYCNITVNKFPLCVFSTCSPNTTLSHPHTCAESKGPPHYQILSVRAVAIHLSFPTSQRGDSCNPVSINRCKYG